MAVHTAVFQLLVMSQGIHIEVLHATLLDLYVVPDLIVGLDETVGEIGVNLVFYDLPFERFVFCPLSIDQEGL